MEDKLPDRENVNCTADLIHQIKIGALDAKLLKKAERQLCVEALFLEAVSPINIAQFLKVTDRTIRRDLEAIRYKYALDIDPDRAREILGEFLLYVRIHHSNLMKLARNADGSIGARAQAEFYSHLVFADGISKFQSLGYLSKPADKKEKGASDAPSDWRKYENCDPKELHEMLMNETIRTIEMLGSADREKLKNAIIDEEKRDSENPADDNLI